MIKQELGGVQQCPEDILQRCSGIFFIGKLRCERLRFIVRWRPAEAPQVQFSDNLCMRPLLFEHTFDHAAVSDLGVGAVAVQ
jgi:hypothetical protein